MSPAGKLLHLVRFLQYQNRLAGSERWLLMLAYRAPLVAMQ